MSCDHQYDGVGQLSETGKRFTEAARSRGGNHSRSRTRLGSSCGHNDHQKQQIENGSFDHALSRSKTLADLQDNQGQQ